MASCAAPARGSIDRSIDHSIDPLDLRRALGAFPTGISVITARDGDGRPRGMTANSFTAVSLDPPLLLVCVGKSASSFPAFADCEAFGVNLLHERQQSLSRLFASKTTDKFSGVDHAIVTTGAPILKDCLTWFDCCLHQRVDAGDHIVLLGRIAALGTTTLKPLAFYRGRYASVGDATNCADAA
jgi:flavin reductase (DIM6/NTAB) family NADH-FMN oxidoreductase RutF